MPFRVFFEAGLIGQGILVLLLQLSLVFWPLAVRRARHFQECAGVQRLLDAFSQSHHARSGPYAEPVKRFRQRETPKS